MSNAKLASVRHHCHLSAIALNNVAIRLLVKKSFADAVESLEHANSLIRFALSETVTDIPTNGGEELVNRALRALSSSSSSSSSSLQQEGEPPDTITRRGEASPDPSIFRVLTSTASGSLTSDQAAGTFMDLDGILADVPCSDINFLLRIEDFPESYYDHLSTATDTTSLLLKDAKISAERHLAVISHNSSVACTDGSGGYTKDPRRLSVALVYSRQASQLLLQQLHHQGLQSSSSSFSGNTPNQLSNAQTENLASLIMLILNTTLQLEKGLRMRQEVSETYGLLVHIRSMALQTRSDTAADAVGSSMSVAANVSCNSLKAAMAIGSGAPVA